MYEQINLFFIFWPIESVLLCNFCILILWSNWFKENGSFAFEKFYIVNLTPIFLA